MLYLVGKMAKADSSKATSGSVWGVPGSTPSVSGNLAAAAAATNVWGQPVVPGTPSSAASMAALLEPSTPAAPARIVSGAKHAAPGSNPDNEKKHMADSDSEAITKSDLMFMFSAMRSDMEMPRFEKSVWSPPIACVIGSSNAAMEASVTSPAAAAGVVGSSRHVGTAGTGVLIAMRAALPCFKTSGVAGDGGARSPPRRVPGIRRFVTAGLCECDDAE